MTDDYLTNPHDRFFKESFARVDIARSFVREYLPRDLSKLLNLKQMEILKDTYVDKELSEHFSDLVYKVRIKNRISFLYLLFEHKSYVDHWVGLQLLRNMVKIWETYRKQHRKSKTLPVIVPIVIYHGREKWTMDSPVAAMFDTVPETEKYVPGFRAEVLDISHIPDDRITGEILLRVQLLIQKYIFKRELFGKLHEILALLAALSSKRTRLEYLEVLLRYLFASVDDKKRDDLKEEIESAIDAGGDLMPTIAEKWIEEGIEKGIERRDTEMVSRMASSGMTNAQIRDLTGLSIKRISEIRKATKK